MLSRHAKRIESCDGCITKTCSQEQAQDRRSTCVWSNYGSYDAWVGRFDSAPDLRNGSALADLLSSPRHAFGTENMLGHVFERYLGRRLRNRCRTYRIYHLHCHFKTSLLGVGNAPVTERGYGQGFIGHIFVVELLRRHEKNLSFEQASALMRHRWIAEW